MSLVSCHGAKLYKLSFSRLFGQPSFFAIIENIGILPFTGRYVNVFRFDEDVPRISFHPTAKLSVEKPHTFAKFSGGVVYFSPGRCVPFDVEGPLEALRDILL